MKAGIFGLVAVAFSSSAFAANTKSPVSKVLELLSTFQSKISAEGEAADKTYNELVELCEDRSKELAFEIKTGKSEVAELKAAIEQETASTMSLTAKIEGLAADVAADESDLKKATAIRKTEAGDFAKQEKELTEVIDTLERASGILQKEGVASLTQLSSAGSVIGALRAMVQASMISSEDGAKLTALAQSSTSQESDDSDGSLGAPAASVYEGHSAGIIDTVGDLADQAQAQLSESRSKETNALHNFEMLKQSLEDQIKFGNKDMAKAKKGLAASGQKKAVAEGDLVATSKDVKEDTVALEDLRRDCTTKAEDYEAAKESRGEELKAIAAAIKVISEKTGDAESITYGLDQVSSFLQLKSGATSSNVEAVRVVRQLAEKQNSRALTQLASRLSSVMQLSSQTGSDPFEKVKGLISDMILKLEGDASADADQKAYCDKETAESTSKQTDLDTEHEKLTTKIDQASSRSQQLKSEVATLQNGLAELVASQIAMDKLRNEEHELFVTTKAEMEEGLEGVKLALKVLNDYYAGGDKAHDAAEGASTGIIGLLEVIESDFSKGLAEKTATEESAASIYDQESKENEIEKATKEQDVKYKSKEAVDLDKAVSEMSSDRSDVQDQLAAVTEYLAKLNDQCVAKPETYEERAKSREAELAGLNEALQILDAEGEVSLVQSSHRALRGVKPHGRV